jgi:hypothetical protein
MEVLLRMPSSFTWVDFAEEDRRKMAEVIDLFREQDTRDELGLGVIRDAFADLLFPGTSTIQTRAKYFLFVPWIYRRHEARGTSATDIARRARRDEIALIESLVEAGEHNGVIGIERRGELQRLPSSIYWAGLGVWRVRRFSGSQERYHRAWDSILRQRRDTPVNDDKELAGGSYARTWDPELPEAPGEFPKRASFNLTRAEAEYLQQRVLELGSTLLGHLICATKPAEQTEFPWVHPDMGSFPDAFKVRLEHARQFSEVMHGAGLLYNIMLAEERGNAEWLANYRKRFATWATLLVDRRAVYRRWQRVEFWALADSTRARVTLQTRRFVDTWLDLAIGTVSPRSLGDHEGARTLVREREKVLKRARARLGDPRALERWNGASGAEQLNYRWHRVRTIVGDILRGLGKDK